MVCTRTRTNTFLQYFSMEILFRHITFQIKFKLITKKTEKRPKQLYIKRGGTAHEIRCHKNDTQL